MSRLPVSRSIQPLAFRIRSWGVLEQMADVAEGGVELAVADGQHCRHDGYALFPQVGAVEKAWRGVVAFHYLVAYKYGALRSTRSQLLMPLVWVR